MTNDTMPPPPSTEPSEGPSQASVPLHGLRPCITDVDGFDESESTHTDGDPDEVERLWRLSHRTEGT